MNNKSFDDFTNIDYSNLSNWLNNLNPYEFSLSGVIASFIISIPLNANQMNSIGNYLEEIGQILLTIAAQKITVNQAKKGNNTSVGNFDQTNSSVFNDINDLKNIFNNKN